MFVEGVDNAADGVVTERRKGGRRVRTEESGKVGQKGQATRPERGQVQKKK